MGGHAEEHGEWVREDNRTHGDAARQEGTRDRWVHGGRGGHVGVGRCDEEAMHRVTQLCSFP